MQPAPVFLPGKLYGQRSLPGYSPWGGKESDMTERLSTHTRMEDGKPHRVAIYVFSTHSPCKTPLFHSNTAHLIFLFNTCQQGQVIICKPQFKVKMQAPLAFCGAGGRGHRAAERVEPGPDTRLGEVS